MNPYPAERAKELLTETKLAVTSSRPNAASVKPVFLATGGFHAKLGVTPPPVPGIRPRNRLERAGAHTPCHTHFFRPLPSLRLHLGIEDVGGVIEPGAELLRHARFL